MHRALLTVALALIVVTCSARDATHEGKSAAEIAWNNAKDIGEKAWSWTKQTGKDSWSAIWTAAEKHVISSDVNRFVVNEGYKNDPMQHFIGLYYGDRIPKMRDHLLQLKAQGDGFWKRHLKAWSVSDNWAREHHSPVLDALQWLFADTQGVSKSHAGLDIARRQILHQRPGGVNISIADNMFVDDDTDASTFEAFRLDALEATLARGTESDPYIDGFYSNAIGTVSTFLVNSPNDRLPKLSFVVAAAAALLESPRNLMFTLDQADDPKSVPLERQRLVKIWMPSFLGMTEFGAALFEADLLMKRLASGRVPMPATVRQFSNCRPTHELRGTNADDARVNRWWFVVNEATVRRSLASVSVKSISIGVRTRALEYSNGESGYYTDSATLRSLAAERFAACLTDHFDLLSAHFKEFQLLEASLRAALLAEAALSMSMLPEYIIASQMIRHGWSGRRFQENRHIPVERVDHTTSSTVGGIDALVAPENLAVEEQVLSHVVPARSVTHMAIAFFLHGPAPQPPCVTFTSFSPQLSCKALLHHVLLFPGDVLAAVVVLAMLRMMLTALKFSARLLSRLRSWRRRANHDRRLKSARLRQCTRREEVTSNKEE